MADEPLPGGTFVSYVKLSRNQFCSISILAKFGGAPAVTAVAVSAMTGGRSSGSSRKMSSGGESDVALRSASASNRGIAETMSNMSPDSSAESVLTSDADSEL